MRSGSPGGHFDPVDITRDPMQIIKGIPRSWMRVAMVQYEPTFILEHTYRFLTVGPLMRFGGFRLTAAPFLTRGKAGRPKQGFLSTRARSRERLARATA